MNKIIFLDIDGVLVNRNSLKADHEYAKTHGGHRPMEKFSAHYNSFDSECVQRLNQITDVTGAVFVISSTWRMGRTVSELRDILSSRGVAGKVLDKTTTKDYNGYKELTRGDQIEEFIKSYSAVRPIDKFIIIDDDSDMSNLMDRLVQTNFEDGLRDEDVKKAISMLS